MLRPKLPHPPAVPTTHLITTAAHHQAPAPCACQHTPVPPASAASRSLAPYVAAGAGAVAGVLVVGVVLTALLATVAITAASVAVCAVVLRSLAGGPNRRHR